MQAIEAVVYVEQELVFERTLIFSFDDEYLIVYHLLNTID